LGGNLLHSFDFYNHSKKVNHKQIGPKALKKFIIWPKLIPNQILIFISAKAIPNQKYSN